MIDKLISRELSPKETALRSLAEWWGKQLFAYGEELMALPFWSGLESQHYYAERRPYALVTHHCPNELAKQGIEELGGVIGVPGYYSVFSGSYASNQVLHSLGVSQKEGYGQPFDGLTHMYLQPLPFELIEACAKLRAAQNPGMWSGFMNREDLSPRRFEFEIEQVLDAPWEPLTVDLTETEEGRAKLRHWLKGKVETNFDDPDFVYRLRRLENKYCLAVI